MSTDNNIYLVAWTGGYEMPSYAVQPNREAALRLAEEWKADADDESDIIDALCINPESGIVEVIG